MDGAIYQKWIEDIDALSEAQREEVQKILAGRSSEAEVIAALEGRLLADRVCPLCAGGGGGVPWPCERLASVLLRGVRQDLQRPDGDAVGKPALQGTLVRLRPVAERGGIGAQVGGPVRRRGEHRLPMAASLSAGDQNRYGPYRRNRRGRRDLCPGKPQGIARLEKCRCGAARCQGAGAQAPQARRQSQPARPVQ